jgi:CDP-diacylglycerol--serine O-phosphatidyltransferase
VQRQNGAVGLPPQVYHGGGRYQLFGGKRPAELKTEQRKQKSLSRKMRQAFLMESSLQSIQNLVCNVLVALNGGVANSWAILVLIVLMSGLLVAEIPMFSLKFKNFSWKSNQLQFVFLGVCIVLIALLLEKAFAPIILWYLLLSVVSSFFKKD